MWISPIFVGQLNAWINRKLVSKRASNFYSALSRNNGVSRGGAFHRRKWFCKQRNWFYLELDSTISLELTDLLDDKSIFWEELKSADSDPNHRNFNLGNGTSAGRKKQQQKANRAVGVIVAQNNQSSQRSILEKRRRRAIRTKTLKCKQITVKIKTGKQQRCY